MKKTHILFSVVLTIFTLLVASEVRAQLIPPIAPQRTCTAGTFATIDAGAILGNPVGQPSGDFPRLVVCPAECQGASLNGQFLRWEYRVTNLPKASPSNVGFQVASDIAIEAAPQASEISNLCSGISSLKNTGANDCDSRWLRFAGNSNSSELFVSYYTKPGVDVRPEGVVVTSGRSVAGCLLAGAGKQITQPKSGIITQIISQLGPCQIHRNVDGLGFTIDMTLLSGDPAQCVISLQDPPTLANGAPAVFGTPDSQITYEGSCTNCYWTRTTFGGLKQTCVTTNVCP